MFGPEADEVGSGQGGVESRRQVVEGESPAFGSPQSQIPGPRPLASFRQRTSGKSGAPWSCRDSQTILALPSGM
jgi:hypothetical protein